MFMSFSRVMEFFLLNSLTLFFLKWFTIELFTFFTGRKLTRKQTMLCLFLYICLIVFPISFFTEIGADGWMTERSSTITTVIMLIGEIVFYLFLNRGITLRGISAYFVVETVFGVFDGFSILFVGRIIEQLGLTFPWAGFLNDDIVMPILYLLFIKLIHSVNVSPFIDSLFETRKRAILSTVSFLFLVYLDSIIELLAPEFTKEYPFAHNLFIFILVCFLLIFCAFYKNAQLRIAEQEATLLQQEGYVKSLESIQRDMRTLQHDYKNILSGLYLQSEEGKTEEIKAYLSQTLGQLDENVAKKIKETTHLSNIQVSAVKSMVLTKLAAMEQQGIQCNLEVSEPIKNINMDLNDFVRCLGILLDNAIEEVQQLQVQTAKLDVVLSNEAEDLTVIIKNPTRKKPEIHQIWQEGFSTKGNNRGLGLFSYQRILSKYQHVYKQTVAKDNEFVQILTIKN
ncbi:sensor histidine kinase [Candidatus Enterococcus ferrettii]|uniref:Two-component system, LytTR family, sensor histidine kinase AgrC n=1 Tax=Candidatus Enterococcus ferrettii TaxID=2815324 RepID=A0ABV0EUZ0_9ENTE|nr:GHKL domain-containing protein [Enterococcus sp. 665A]MBO1341687.1 GHKL domain-containing protein [Enterococcus sp. 665A]